MTSCDDCSAMMGIASSYEGLIDFHMTDLGDRPMSSSIRISAKNLGALA